MASVRHASAAKTKMNDLPPVRVKYLPPTLEEAIFAAQGITDELEHQAEIASDLMDVPVPEILVMLKERAAKEAKRNVSGRLTLRSSAPNQVFVSQRSGHERAVVVERKVSRFRQPVLNLPMR